MTMPDCGEIRDLLDSYIAGELLVETNHRVLRHVQGCAACRHELDARAVLRTTLRTLPAPERAPARLALAIDAHIRTTDAPATLPGAGRRWWHALLAAAAAITLVVVLWPTFREQPLNAHQLLARAAAIEARPAATSGLVHRVVLVEERTLETGTLAGRTRVESWSDHARGLHARRAFDAREQLVAGEFRNGSERRTYKRGVGASEGPDPTAASLVLADESWRLELSAESILRLQPAAAGARVADLGDALVLDFSWPAAQQGVTRAQLFLRADDLHAFEQRLVVQGRDSVREVRLTEAESAIVDASQAPGQLFEPDADLVATAAAPVVPPAARTTAPPPSLPSAEVVSLDTEIAVLHRLHQLGLFADGRATVVRQVDGGLTVVAADAALLPTVQEAISGISVRVQFESHPPTAAPPDEDAPLEVWRTVVHGRLARLDALFARRPDSGQSVSLDSASTWQSMVRDLTRDIARTSASTARALNAAAVGDVQSPIAIHSTSDAQRAVKRLAELSAQIRNDDVPAVNAGRLAAIERQAAEFEAPWPLDGKGDLQ